MKDTKPDFISSYLTHWVGRKGDESEHFEIVKKILSENLLRLSRCPTGDKVLIQKSESFYEYIVCFTDIPLAYSSEHCSQFGRFGVSFNKERFIEYGANPVLYCTPTMGRSYQEAINIVQEKLQEWWPMDEWDKHSRQYRSLRMLFSFLQTYEYDRDHSPNYYQREWRISLDHEKVPHEGRELRPGSHTYDTEEDCGWMVFDKGDVEKIIVSKKYHSEAVDLFHEFGENAVLAYEDMIR